MDGDATTNANDPLSAFARNQSHEIGVSPTGAGSADGGSVSGASNSEESISDAADSDFSI
jgi:hypothetical protein